jgi:hypothetical protein
MSEGDLSWAIQWVTNWWSYGYIHALMTNLKELFTSSSAKVKPIESINWNPTYLSYSMQYSKTLLHLTRAYCNQSFCLLCTSLPSTVLYTTYKTTKTIPKGKRRWGVVQFISCAILHVKSTSHNGKLHQQNNFKH